MFRSRETKAFVPASELGEIGKLPGVGTRFVILAQFQREGLKTLYNKSPYQSHMFTNRRLPGAKRHNFVQPDRKCHGCNRSFGDIYGFKTAGQIEALGHVLVVPEHVGHERFFCWSCASSRDTMISACGTEFADYIAEDGQDVFAFIAQTVYEDSLADRFGNEALACHNDFRPAAKYRKVIGGRLKTFEERNT